MVEVDVRGLSCPEPVLLTLDAIAAHPGEEIEVTGDEAHTKKNIESTLMYEKKEFTSSESNGEYKIKFRA